MVPIRFLSFVALAVLLLSAGCNDPGPIRPSDTSAIMPLAVGNRWIGRTTTYTAQGKVTSVAFDTLRVVSETVEGGEQWFLTDRGIAYVNRPDGCWRSIGGPSSDPWLVAKYPAETLDTFNVMLVESMAQHGTGIDSLVMSSVVSSTNMRSQVPGGDFLCYQYKVELTDLRGMPLRISDFPNQDDYQGFAPGIGPVVREYFSIDADGGTYRWKRWELMQVVLQ